MAAEITSHTGNIVTVTITDMLSYLESAVLQKLASAGKAISVCYWTMKRKAREDEY